MKTCANCAKPALYNYMATLYCADHLPRFLQTRTGVSVLVRPVTQDVSEKVTWVAPTGEAVETFVEGVEPPAEEKPTAEDVEKAFASLEAPKPTPKKAKPTPKEAAPKAD